MEGIFLLLWIIQLIILISGLLKNYCLLI